MPKSCRGFEPIVTVIRGWVKSAKTRDVICGFFLTYKALNKLIQVSAADMTKKAMLDLFKAGIIPHIQVHDELDISVKDDKEAKKIIEIMESAVDLEVPNKVDYETGKNWGDIK